MKNICEFLGSILFVCLCCISIARGDTASQNNRAYLHFGVGGSFSTKGSIDVPMKVDPIIGSWDSTPEGYNSNLGSTSVYGFGFGYDVVPLLSLELNYDTRPSYKYKKTQSSTVILGVKTRYFDLNNSSLMLNAIFHLEALSEKLQYQRNSSSIVPFINLGAGVARNTVTNFHSESHKTPGVVFSMMSDKTTHAFTTQIGAGFKANFSKRWFATAAYRFVYSDTFKTQNYIIDDPDKLQIDPPTGGSLAQAWSGKLKANEVYFDLAYRLN